MLSLIMILFKLKKKWAKTNIIIEESTQMKDDWFIDIKRVTKTGIVNDTSTIIRKDVDSWLNGFLKDGWEIFDDEKEKK